MYYVGLESDAYLYSSLGLKSKILKHLHEPSESATFFSKLLCKKVCLPAKDSRMASSSVASRQLEISKSGIPKAPFITDVEAHLGGADEDAEPHLRKFQETMSKYKMMEVDRQQRKRALEEKIPEMKKTLTMVEHIKSKRVSVFYCTSFHYKIDVNLLVFVGRKGDIRDTFRAQ